LILGCFIAVGAVALATAAAGRLVGMSLTAAASGLMAFLMPPVFSLRVESSAGVAALILNGVAGLVVSHTVRPRRPTSPSQAVTQDYCPRPSSPTGPTLGEAILLAIEQEAALRGRASDIHVHVGHAQHLSISLTDLDMIVRDVLRIALSPTNVRSIDIYSGQRPTEHCIRIAAVYAADPVVPCLKITGRMDDSCVALELPSWPGPCSATWFDNGFELIYQIRIKRDTERRQVRSLPGTVARGLSIHNEAGPPA